MGAALPTEGGTRRERGAFPSPRGKRGRLPTGGSAETPPTIKNDPEAPRAAGTARSRSRAQGAVGATADGAPAGGPGSPGRRTAQAGPAIPAVGREAEAQPVSAGTCQGHPAIRGPFSVECLQQGVRGVSGQPASNTWHPQVTYRPQNRQLMKQTSQLPPVWGPRPPVIGSVSLGWGSPLQGVKTKESCPLGPLPSEAGSCLRSHVLDFM